MLFRFIDTHRLAVLWSWCLLVAWVSACGYLLVLTSSPSGPLSNPDDELGSLVSLVPIAFHLLGLAALVGAAGYACFLVVATWSTLKGGTGLALAALYMEARLCSTPVR